MNASKGMFGNGNAGSVAGAVASIGGNLADALNPPNKYGRQKLGVTIGKGAAQGASMGAALGPWGMAAGAVVGGAVGFIQGKAQKKAEQKAIADEQFNEKQRNMAEYQALAANDPSSVWGNKGGSYFANGGNLYTDYLKSKVSGGSLKKLSSDVVEVQGPSHENGGVQLPEGNEVEGKETIKGSFVFSDRLGFAKLHKPIAKAIGKLEQKAPTRASVNSLKRLKEQEEALMILQEHYKQQNNIA